MKTLRQDVHQESPEELDAGQSAQLPLIRVPLLVFERHMSIVHGDDPGVGDGDAKGVASQVIHDGLLGLAIVLTE